MEASRSSGSSNSKHRSGRSTNYDDDGDDDDHHHRRDYPEHRRDSRRYDSGSSSSRRDHHRHRDRSPRDTDRYESSRRRYHGDYHSTNSSSGRSRRHRSRTPSSPSSRSATGRRTTTRDSESRSSRRRADDRDSSRGRSPTIRLNHPADNVRILRASRSITPTLPQSSSHSSDRYAEERRHDMHHHQHHTSDPNSYFDGIKSEELYIPSTEDGDFDKEQIHKEMQERLIRHLAREGKVYPPPKPQASHPVFANDGSFLETFKRLQEQKQEPGANAAGAGNNNNSNNNGHKRPTAGQPAAQQPMFGKRRGGKILKTGVVAKPKVVEEEETANKNDAWAMYLQEVKKYKSVSCDTDAKTRPLVK